jgi:hypothetical protein
MRENLPVETLVALLVPKMVVEKVNYKVERLDTKKA